MGSVILLSGSPARFSTLGPSDFAGHTPAITRQTARLLENP